VRKQEKHQFQKNDSLLEDSNIEYCFNKIVIPIMVSELEEVFSVLYQIDNSTGKMLNDQMNEIDSFLNEVNKI